MKTGFEPGSQPVFEPERRVMHMTLPGIAPSLKVDGGYVRTRLPLMLDGMLHLETNPAVARIRPYPIRIEYASSQTSEMFKMREHTFDLGVELHDGRRIYIDYEPLAIQQERRWIADRTERLQDVTRRELGADYAVHDERTLYIQPRFANIKIIYRHMRVKDHDALMVVRRVVAQMAMPTNIAAVRNEAKLRQLRFEVSDLTGQTIAYTKDLDGVDRVFTAIMQMVAMGEVCIDLARPFSDASILSEPAV
ncbi:hypothetical protein [Neorhizobium galegae]|uniref:hypothetical protein n=1 Tax=Neorhizobium galegae TaxID=399 RepID=UPI0020359BDC|nr:hypothetical protein [Neorhizobium galegae]MCM2501959.1 hypothetical protein [Neorhizobium galegae]MCQ1772914.1 hypothetical protein [Neorhizobium galegae]MCQ1799418.1 hypothetical protein [Neorhizobium galegae]